MNRTSEYKLTIIIPVYNEVENLDAVERKVGDFLKSAKVKTCVLLVNDGSSDDSLAKIKEICARNDDFFYLSFKRNSGLSAAIKAGMDYSDSDLVGYIDADLQTNPEDFNLLLEYADDYDMVTGIRANRKDSGFKKFQSKVANNFRRFLTKDEAIDTGCPLKIFRSEVAAKFPFFNGNHRFFAALVALQNGKIKQIPVRHYPRSAGESKFSLKNRLAGPFVDCFGYRWLKKRWRNYEVEQSKIQ